MRVNSDRQDKHTLALRLAVFYAALFLIYGVHVPYFPVWLDGRGLTPAEIGLITASPFFLRVFVTPTAAVIADSHGSHRRMIVRLAWVAFAVVLSLSAATGFWAILLLSGVFALAASTIMPLTETVAVEGVRTSGLDYGRVRLWGSVAFIVAGFMAGALIDRFGAEACLWLIVAGAAATVAASYGLSGPSESRPPPRSRSGLALTDALNLARNRTFLTFLLAVGAVQGAHATFYTFGALNWQAQGISSVWVSALWAIGVTAEVAVFAWSRAIIDRIEPARLLVLGAAAAMLRWSVMSLDPPLALLMPLQALHGLTYGAAHVAAIHVIARAVPTGLAGTAQALYATMAAGLVMGAVTVASGPLYARYAGGTFVFPALLAAVGFLAALVLYRTWDGRLLWPERTS